MRNSGVLYTYFLFEHKSYIGKDIAFQLLRYMVEVEIWGAKIKKEKADELPVIIPLVVYHGKDHWKIGTTLGEMIMGYEDLPEAEFFAFEEKEKNWTVNEV